MKPTNKRLPALRFLKLNEGQLPGWPARASRTVSRGSHPEGRSVAEDPRSGLTAAAERARGERVPSEARAFRYAPHPPTPVSGEPILSTSISIESMGASSCRSFGMTTSADSARSTRRDSKGRFRKGHMTTCWPITGTSRAPTGTSSQPVCARRSNGRVEGRRVTGRARWLIRRFRTGPQSEAHRHVSSPRSPNPACRFPAPGSPVESCGSHTGFPGATSGRVSRSRGTRLAPLRRSTGWVVRPVDALTTATARAVPFAYACDDVRHCCSSPG